MWVSAHGCCVNIWCGFHGRAVSRAIFLTAAVEGAVREEVPDGVLFVSFQWTEEVVMTLKSHDLCTSVNLLQCSELIVWVVLSQITCCFFALIASGTIFFFLTTAFFLLLLLFLMSDYKQTKKGSTKNILSHINWTPQQLWLIKMCSWSCFLFSNTAFSLAG